MVRAIALQTNPSGSYYDPSQGIFATVTVGNTAPPITVTAAKVSGGVKLAWNSQAGTTYRVLSRTNLNQVGWVDLSGTISASGSTLSWTDTGVGGAAVRFYRIATP
jgi:hypothetical protein